MKNIILLSAVTMLVACSEAKPLIPVNNATVTKTDRIQIGEREQYMIYTDKGVFKNVDSRPHSKHNSADLYAIVEEGQTCNFMIVGERDAKRSRYPNVITADCR